MTSWDADGAFGLVGGCATVVGAAFVAAAMFGPAEHGARLVVMALAAAVMAASTRDWRATAGVTLLAVLIFVGFLAGRDGVLTGDPGGWAAAAAIPAAALLGRLRRPPARVARRVVVDRPPRRLRVTRSIGRIGPIGG